jgi:hypothetical protein
LDTKGNIFGGFTPVKLEGRKWNGRFGNEDNCFKADPTLKSFVFTLKNPHNLSARRFTLRVTEQDHAICCDSARGPHFRDIVVSDNCNANSKSNTLLGFSYINNSGLNEKVLFTGSSSFQVKEIEVFEITH